MLEPSESRTSNQRDETTGVKSRSKRGNAFEVLAVYDNCPTIPTVPATDVEIPGPLTNTSIDSQDECCLKSAEHSQSSTSDPAIKELPPVNQTEHSLPTDAPEHLSCVVRSSLPDQQPRARANRIKKHSINERNCRSTPVLSTVVPLLYRIAMRKPTRRLLLADTREGKSGRLRTDPPGLGRAQFGTGRLRTGADSRPIWRAQGTISRVDKTTEADLEDLSTQEISINTTTPSNDPTDPDKLRDPSMTPTPFVLVRHKSRRLPAAPVARRHRRHPSRRRSQPVLWRHKSRTVTRGSAWLSARTGVARCAPVLPIRAHSFCAPYAHESNKTSVAIKAGHSDSSSIDGDANDPEYKIWQSRVKSYLDAAAQADALVRSQYDPSALKQWLSPNGELRYPEANSSADEGSPRDVADRQQLRTALTTRMDSTRVVLDYQEPLLTFWDDYQAPLYSSSSDTDGCEPVSTYAEEFPWDDMAASCLSDASQEDLFLREIQASKPKSSPYAPFHSTVTTPANAENGMDQLRVDHDTTEPPVFRQDTMELSTSTSVLFNQKSSSLEASFEVFSHSGTTAETADSPVNESERPELLLCGLRTHPDGGSQHCLTGDFMNGVAEAIVQTAPEYRGSPPDHGHRYSNPYVMDSRKCQTLPRVSAKRKRRQHLTSGTKAQCAGGESRLSATASLDELHDWNNRRSRLDILRFSRQRLQELRALYNRLMRISPGQREDASPDPYSGMTLDHWQNSLSHVIHLAEANLQLLTDSTVGSVAPSNKCCCRNERDVKSPAVPLQSNSSPSRPHKWSNCPELTCLQLQWVQFTDQARYWLLQSYSQQATRHQLTALKARISDLNQTIQRVLTPSITRSEQSRPVCSSGNSQSTLDVHATESSHPRPRIRQHDEEMMKRIRYCVNEVEAVGEQVQRLREEFERHVIHSQRQQQQQQNQQLACDQKSVEPTTSFVALRDESLVQELDQLSDQLSANQERLTSLLAMQSDTLTENSSDEQDWEHVDYPTATGQRLENVPEEKVPKTTAPETVTKIEEQTETSAPILLREPSTIVEPTHHHHQYIVLVAGGLMALACFCCYIVAQLIPCENRPCGWRDSLLLLERVFGLSQEAASGACPLRRERLSSLVDYTPGSLPF